MVTLFSGLSLGPGNYFITMGSDPTSSGAVGWFPALDPTVVLDTGVTQGEAFRTFPSPVAPYPPASDFSLFPTDVSPQPFNFIVTGESVAAIPEPTTTLMVSGALFMGLAVFLSRWTWPGLRVLRLEA